MNKPFEPWPSPGSRRRSRPARAVGVIGLGYVGLPLAAACATPGYRNVCFDVDPEKIKKLNAGRSYIDALSSDTLSKQLLAKRFEATRSSH